MQIKMYGDKFEKNISKLLIGGNTASAACSMQGDKFEKTFPNYLLVAILQALLAVCRGIKNDITAIKVYGHGR